MARPKITVIMPAYQAAHYMALSLPPLMEMLNAGDVDEVLVIDDCSPDPDTLELARKLGAKTMQMPKNGGPGAARNLAAPAAQGDVLWFVDADVVVSPQAARVVAKAFEEAAVVAVFGSYDDRPPAQNFPSQYKNLVHRYYHQRAKAEASTFWAGCGAIRKAAFLAVSGFDVLTYKKPSIEDIELGYRLIDAGGRIVLAHDLSCTHLKNWRLMEVIQTDVFKRAIPWARLLLTRAPATNDLNVSSTEKAKAALAGLWFATLVAAPFLAPPSIATGAIAAVTSAVVLVNWSLFSFFVKARGLGFALAASAFHQVYYCYSAAAYAYCVAERLLGAQPRPKEASA